MDGSARRRRRLVVDHELVDPVALPPPTGGGALDELTDREREVLALMAAGLTDRGIGSASR